MEDGLKIAGTEHGIISPDSVGSICICTLM